jgi:hypothetical protein
MLRKLKLALALGVMGAVSVSGLAFADTLAPIDFESYSTGDINAQNGWTKTGGYDVAVADVADFPAASGYGFGAKALRMSDAVTSGSFGDQTFSPGLADEAGEATADNGGFSGGTRQSHFQFTFSIGTTKASEQPGAHMAVSADRGDGARMSNLVFEDAVNGVHVFFTDVTDPGPVGTPANFSSRDIATLSRGSAHTVTESINFVDGAGNDVVTISVDGTQVATGGTWEDYYRFDPEQASNGNAVPTVDQLLFREAGSANAADAGQGFLLDGLTLSSGPIPPTPTGGVAGGVAGGGAGGVAGQTGSNAKKCKKKHKKHHSRQLRRCKKHKKHH